MPQVQTFRHRKLEHHQLPRPVTMRLSPELREQILNQPAEATPPGVNPTFEPQVLFPAGEPLVQTLFAVSTVLFAVRMYAQACIHRKMILED
jgi:hypothetical protein